MFLKRMRISNNNTINTAFRGNLSKLSRACEVFYDKNSVIPVLFIETGVTLGRTYEANKKGGKKEAIERFVEQGVSAAVWLWGVQGIRKSVDFVADKLKINKTQNFKNANILSSIALATGFIGFVLPKINHKISSALTKDDKKKDKTTVLKPLSFEEYKEKQNKNLSFGSLSSVANLIENNSTARLFITDLGVISGRFKNGRNKYERIEGLFRDISSIFFYLCSTDLIAHGLNKITNNTDIAPSKLENLVDEFKKTGNFDNIKDKKSLEFISKLKNQNIETIENAAKSTINKNFLHYSIGVCASAFALGIMIPKIQYMIRSKLTNQDTFPGDDNYQANK